MRPRIQNLGMLGILALLTFGLTSCGDRWNRSFDPGDDGPHGTLMLTRFLRAISPAAKFEELTDLALEDLDTLQAQQSLYVAIGAGLPYDSLGVRRLSSFIRQGGTALLNAEEVSIALTRELVADGCLSEADFELFTQTIYVEDDSVFAYTSDQARISVPAVVYRKGGMERISLSALPNRCYPRVRPLMVLQRVGRALDGLSFDGSSLDVYHIDYPTQPLSKFFESDPAEVDTASLDREQTGAGFAETPPENTDNRLDTSRFDQDLDDAPPSSLDDTSEEDVAENYDDSDGDAEGYPVDATDTDYEEDADASTYAEAQNIAPPTNEQLAAFPAVPIAGAFPILVDVPFGRGRLLLHTAPILLTNAYLAEPAGRPYVEKLAAYLPSDVTTIIFDINRRTSVESVWRDNRPEDTDYSQQEVVNNSVLRELLARPPLRIAWYMLLLGALSFVILGARRRQRAVPIVQPRRNTTLDYLGSVSRLYLSRPNNSRMAAKELAMFESYCQRKLGLRPFQNESDLPKLLAIKGVDRGRVESLLRYASSVQSRKPLSNDSYLQLLTILRSVYTSLGRRPARTAKI